MAVVKILAVDKYWDKTRWRELAKYTVAYKEFKILLGDTEIYTSIATENETVKNHTTTTLTKDETETS